MTILKIMLYALLTAFYLVLIINSKTIINYLKECIYLFINTEWEDEE